MKSIILLLSLFVVSIGLQGQIEENTTWKTSVAYPENGMAEITFTATTNPKWHFYSLQDEMNPMLFTFTKSSNYQTEGNVIEKTKPTKEYDDLMEANRYFYNKSAKYVQKIILNTNKPFEINVTIDYQSCFEDGKCVMEDPDLVIKITPPEGIQVVDTTKTIDSSLVTGINNKDTSVTSENTGNSEQLSPQDLNKKKSLWDIVLEAIFWGLISIFTPCIFPMIPMTISFFMKEGQSKIKNRINAISYGISIVVLYTVPIAIIILTTYLIGGKAITADIFNWLSTHWIPNIIFFLIFMIFAASFFGMFEIVLPSWMVGKADSKADKGGIVGSFFMALTLVLVSFSCTGPLIGNVMVQSTHGGEFLEPIIAMFAFSVTFAIPFTLFAIFPGWLTKLPKSGGWLNAVKVVLGFLELALGLKFLSVADQTYHWGILDREVYLALWIVIFALMGFYLLGKLKFAHDSDLKHIGVPRLMLAIASFSFVVYMIPGLWGAPLKMLSGYMPPQNSLDFDLPSIIREDVILFSGNGNEEDNAKVCEKPRYGDFLHLPHGLEGYFDFEQGLKCAKQQNKPVFIDFTGHGCVNCREMEANVWSNPKVLKILREKFVVVALYVDDKTELPQNEWITSTYDGKVKKSIGKKYADYQISRFGINAQPYYVLLDHKGEMLTTPHVYNLDVDAFVDFLNKGLKEFEKRTKPETP